MATRKPPAKDRRSTARLVRPRVLVTAAASSLGRVLCRRLHRSYDVLAVDTRPFPDRPKDVEHAEVDLRRKAAQTLIKKRRPDLVVLLGPWHDERPARTAATLESTATLLQLVEDIGAKKLVVLSAASLYGPSPTSASFLSEDAPLLGGQRSRAVADAIAVDMMVQSFFWKAPATETVILRLVHVVGPHLQNLASRFLRQRRVATLLGFDPMMQLVHEDDVVDAVALALAPDKRGVFNVVGPTQAPLSRILAARRAQVVPLPGFLLGPALVRARALRLTRLDDSELVHLKYSCLVDGARAAAELGFVARRSLQQTLVDVG
ncbi:MAG: NAD-dependent epimerase/dehydratase family protein [Deltaproteobacteria bacterium]|nr:NAD-dependent epimerase/dehydratase family protein [Deltaproteobacteria bacterium]